VLGYLDSNQEQLNGSEPTVHHVRGPKIRVVEGIGRRSTYSRAATVRGLRAQPRPIRDRERDPRDCANPSVPPPDVLERRELDVLVGVPRAGAADELGLVEPVHRLGVSVVIAVADGPGRGLHAEFGDPVGAWIPTVGVDGSSSSAAAVLIEQGEHAEMIVVDSRGHGGLAALLLGSINEAVDEHAPCPVLVFHEDKSVAKAA
jgi:nucleotide-binding universal stress UspA family protein